jgi:hypothetical protein
MVILGLAVCAVLAGARSFTAIAGWAGAARIAAALRYHARRPSRPRQTITKY